VSSTRFDAGYFEYALNGSVLVFRLVDGPSEIQTLEVACDGLRRVGWEGE
jgi:hypothetical protein